MGGQRHAPAALPPVITRCPLYRKLGGPQSPPGRVRKISSPQEFDSRTVQTLASSYTDWAIQALKITCTSYKQRKVPHIHCQLHTYADYPRAVSTSVRQTDDVCSLCKMRLVETKYCPITGHLVSSVPNLYHHLSDVYSTNCYQECICSVAGLVPFYKLYRFTYFGHAAKCTNNQPEISVQWLRDIDHATGFRCRMIMAETGRDEVFNMFLVPLIYLVFHKCLYLR